MFAFICNDCGYGIAILLGMPFMCPACDSILCFRRASHEEYHNQKTNDGKIKKGK